VLITAPEKALIFGDHGLGVNCWVLDIRLSSAKTGQSKITG